MKPTRSTMTEDDQAAVDYLLEHRADELPVAALDFLAGLHERQPASITQRQREWLDDLWKQHAPSSRRRN